MIKMLGSSFNWLLPLTIFVLCIYFSFEFPIIRAFLILVIAGVSIHLTANMR